MQLRPILRQALALWQNPSINELAEEDFLDCANRCISQHFLDLDLTPDACFSTEKTAPFTFASSTAREKDLSAFDDISRVTRVESRARTSSNEDDWSEERVASYDNWNEISERGDADFVAFRGVPPELTLVVGRDVSNTEFRLVYRQLRDKIVVPEEFVALPGIYEPVLVYDIALEMGELIDNQSPEFAAKKATKMPYLLERLRNAVERTDKWRRSQRGTSPTHRRSFADRNDGIHIRPRRFTVNF